MWKFCTIFTICLVIAEATVIEEVPFNSLSTKERTLVTHVKESVRKAEAGESKLSGPVLDIEGYSGLKIKYLLNHLCTLPNANYFEIGCLHGSTLCAAVYGNESTLHKVVGVDNWTEFDRPRQCFFNNIAHFIPNANFSMLEQDCFTISLQSRFISPVNIYFYDGAHDYDSQKKAFTYFEPIFDDVFIALVDDWSWQDTNEGSLAGIIEMGYQILYREDLFSKLDGRKEYWNGITVMVLRKS